jgi:hypothetical protein
MLIGLSGKAGCGKSTVAKYLVEEYGFTEVSFAAILKDMLAVAGFPEPADRADKEKIIEGFDFSWRHAAQTLGTEWGRETLDQNIWVKLTMMKLEEGKDYVFADCRFDNESAAIEHKGGININLVGRKVDLGNCSTHTSEAGISEHLIHYTFDNSGEIDYMKSWIDDLVRRESCEWYK